MKKCAKCSKSKDESEFHNNKSSKDGLYHYCKPCARARVNRYHKENPEKARYTREKLYRRHGTNEQKFNEILDSQNNCCAICKKPIDLSKYREINIDHDHGCCEGTYSCGKCIRGLLCSFCNRGLGTFNDSVETLENAIKYLQQTI